MNQPKVESSASSNSCLSLADERPTCIARKQMHSARRARTSWRAQRRRISVVLLHFICLKSIRLTHAASSNIDADWKDALLLKPRTDDGPVVATASIDIENLVDLEELSFRRLPSHLATRGRSNDGAVVNGDNELSVFSKMRAIVKGTTHDGAAAFTEIVWHGIETDQGVGFATLVQDTTTGAICGTVTTNTTTYALVTTADGTVQLRARQWGEYPNDEDEDGGGGESVTVLLPSLFSPLPTTDESVSILPSQIESVLVSEGPAFGAIQLGRDEEEDDGDNEARIRRRKAQQQQHPHTIRKLPGGKDPDPVIFDALVVVTNRAMCEYAGLAAGCSPLFYSNTSPMLQKISLLQAEFNNAMDVVKIPVRVRVVDVRIMQVTAEELYTNTEILGFMANDEIMQQWRDEVSADVVTMIASENPERPACGRAQSGGSFAVASYSCLESYSWTHELGHLFNCSHNRENTGNQDHPYGYGYRKPGSYRTVMSYSCAEDEPCPRIPVFSSADADLRGYGKLGTDEHDNSRLIEESAPVTAAYRTVPTPAPSTLAPTLQPSERPTPVPTTKVPTKQPPGSNDPPPSSPPVDGVIELYCQPDDSLDFDPCPDKNQMHGVLFGFCFSVCVEQFLVWLLRFFNMKCGGC